MKRSDARPSPSWRARPPRRRPAANSCWYWVRPWPARRSCRSTNWTGYCETGWRTKASRMRWRTPSNCPVGHAARSMPAPCNSPGIMMRKAMMAKTDDARPMALLKAAAPKRLAAFRTGVSAETRAAAYLIAKRYRILARRFRTPFGEIDLVARRGNLVVFVEVKARSSLDEAAYAVTPRQQRRIVDAAQAWLAAHPEHAEFELRFDVMLIAPRRLPRHLLAAFDASP